jgi:GMP synthase-like glutamine amidotransferase
MTTNNISGLVFLGAPVSVNDCFPWITAELALIEAGVLSGMPILGICFGGQLISKALGGKVSAASSMQIGWHRITLAAHATDVFGEAVIPAFKTRGLFLVTVLHCNFIRR